MCNGSKKTAQDNAWTSSTTGSLESCGAGGCSCGGNCSCGDKHKTQTDNQWASTTKDGHCGCGCGCK